MAAIMSEDMTREKLGRLFAREMKTSWHAVKRGRGLRKNMEDMDSKQWIRRTTTAPKHTVGIGEIIVYLMNVDYFSCSLICPVNCSSISISI